MRILALDTCLGACSVAVWENGRTLASDSEIMTRGHQERLAPLAQAVMDRAGLGFDELDRIGVTVGPGSFTGQRVGLAFAKGLALALERPCVGVGTLEALAASRAPGGLVCACIDAHRGQVYLQVFIDGRAVMAPDVLPVEIAAARLVEFFTGAPAILVGSGAHLLQPAAPQAEAFCDAAPDPVVVADGGRGPAAVRVATAALPSRA